MPSVNPIDSNDPFQNLTISHPQGIRPGDQIRFREPYQWQTATNNYWVDSGLPPMPTIELDPLTAQLNHTYNALYETLSESIDDPLTQPDIREARIEPLTVVPRECTGKWPIGTIVKWNLNGIGVRDYLKNQGYLDQIFIKILAYDSGGNLKKYHFINEWEPSLHNSVEDKHFLIATDDEAKAYEKAMSLMKPILTMPVIGTVLEYMVNNSRNSHRLCVVIGEASEKRVLIKWLQVARDKLGPETESIPFNKFRIANSQKQGFTLKEEELKRDYCRCEGCRSLRHKDYVKKIQANVFFESIGDFVIKVHTFCDGPCAGQSHWSRCSACNADINISDGLNAFNTQDSHVCRTCFFSFYTGCIECGRYYRVGTNVFDSNVCAYCIMQQRKLIHDHNYKPNYAFQKMAWENTRYLGIELEIEVEADSSSNLSGREILAARIKKWLKEQPRTMDIKMKDGQTIKGKPLNKLVYMKSDGSLNNGIEIVWHPFTLKSFHKNFPLQPFLKFLSENQSKTHSNCGMHIHVSKEKLSTIDLIKGKWFFHKCQPFLKKFSDRKSFSYCKFDAEPPRTDPYRQDYGHYSVLNIASPDAKTLEVRVFNATLNPLKFLANLQFSDVFVDYIQHGAGIAFLKRETPHVIWQNFIDYAKSQNRYHIMTSWILTKGIV